MKVVIDANIMVSIFSKDGTLRGYWSTRDDRNEIFISPEIFLEVESNLRQESFHLSDKDVKNALDDIVAQCCIIRPREIYSGPISEEKDRHLGNLIKEVAAEILVTGDIKLKKLERINTAKVLTCSEFFHSE